MSWLVPLRAEEAIVNRRWLAVHIVMSANR